MKISSNYSQDSGVKTPAFKAFANVSPTLLDSATPALRKTLAKTTDFFEKALPNNLIISIEESQLKGPRHADIHIRAFESQDQAAAVALYEKGVIARAVTPEVEPLIGSRSSMRLRKMAAAPKLVTRVADQSMQTLSHLKAAQIFADLISKFGK